MNTARHHVHRVVGTGGRPEASTARWSEGGVQSTVHDFIETLTDPGAVVMEAKVLRTTRDRVEAARVVSA